MTRTQKRYRDLEGRLDRVSAAFLVGAALLEPYIDMGQPRSDQFPSTAPVTPPQSSPRRDSTNYAAFPPHEQYGNIYFPYHLEQTTSKGSHLRFRVVHADGEIAVLSASWSETTEVARWLNNGERPPAVDLIIARSKERK